MNILVTGHQGYIGYVLAQRLLERGYSVRGIDTGYFDNVYFVGRIKKRERGFSEYKKDIRQITHKDLEGIDGVIHLAALSNDPLGELSPDLTWQINYQASRDLAQLAKEVGVGRFIFFSSCSVYGRRKGEFLGEDAEPEPLTTYALSKVRAEEEILRLADRDFSPIILRNSTVYGLSARMRFDLVVNNLCAWAFTTGRIKIMSDGSPYRPLIHIEDIVRVCLLCLEVEREKINRQIFNVGDDRENWQVKEVAECVKRRFPHSQIEYATNPEVDARSYRVSFAKIKRELGFSASKTLSDGIKELYQALSQVRFDLKQFNRPDYIRLNQLKKLQEQGRLDGGLYWR